MNQDPREQHADEHFARFGGVHFRSHVPPQQINRFIGRLPAGKRDSMFEVLDQLEQAGLITVCNDHVFADGDGVVGGGTTDGQHMT